jgi:hypothetical protein
MAELLNGTTVIADERFTGVSLSTGVQSTMADLRARGTRLIAIFIMPRGSIILIKVLSSPSLYYCVDSVDYKEGVSKMTFCFLYYSNANVRKSTNKQNYHFTTRVPCEHRGGTLLRRPFIG